MYTCTVIFSLCQLMSGCDQFLPSCEDVSPTNSIVSEGNYNSIGHELKPTVYSVYVYIHVHIVY